MNILEYLGFGRWNEILGEIVVAIIYAVADGIETLLSRCDTSE